MMNSEDKNPLKLTKRKTTINLKVFGAIEYIIFINYSILANVLQIYVVFFIIVFRHIGLMQIYCAKFAQVSGCKIIATAVAVNLRAHIS